MKMIEKRKREKLFIDLLNERYGPFPEPEQTEIPDFLIRFQDHILGIECIEIYSNETINGIPIKQQEERKEKIIEKAKRFIVENNLPPIHVIVMFSGSIEKCREEILSLELIKTVVNNYPVAGEIKHIEGWEDDGQVLSSEIKRVSLANIPGQKTHIWHFMEVWCAETDFSEYLQAWIDRKSKKYTKYLENCDECWLVVSALGFSRSTAFWPSREMIEHIYNSPFKRLFFMEAASRYMVELKVSTEAK